MKIQSNRISWIDNTKHVAIFCVVLGHSFSLIKGDFCGYEDFNLFIVAFNMPLFALLSGITSYKSLTQICTLRDLSAYLNKVSWHIGVPTVVYTLIAMSVGYGMQCRWNRCLISIVLTVIVCSLIYLLEFSKFDNKFLKTKKLFPYLILPVCIVNQSVWYFVYVILSLFLASLSALPANNLRRYKLLAFCIIFGLGSIIIARYSPFFSTVEFYLPFVIGYLYSSKNGLEKFSNRPIVLIVLALGECIIGFIAFLNYYSVENQFYLLDYVQAIESGHISIFFIRQISAIALAVSIVFIIQAISNSYNMFSYIGAMTLGIYPIHSEIIGIAKNYIGKISTNNAVLDMLFVFLLAIVLMIVSIFIIRYLRKSQYCCLVFLGDRYNNELKI